MSQANSRSRGAHEVPRATALNASGYNLLGGYQTSCLPCRKLSKLQFVTSLPPLAPAIPTIHAHLEAASHQHHAILDSQWQPTNQILSSPPNQAKQHSTSNCTLSSCSQSPTTSRGTSHDNRKNPSSVQSSASRMGEISHSNMRTNAKQASSTEK